MQNSEAKSMAGRVRQRKKTRGSNKNKVPHVGCSLYSRHVGWRQEAAQLEGGKVHASQPPTGQQKTRSVLVFRDTKAQAAVVFSKLPIPLSPPLSAGIATVKMERYTLR